MRYDLRVNVGHFTAVPRKIMFSLLRTIISSLHVFRQTDSHIDFLLRFIGVQWFFSISSTMFSTSTNMTSKFFSCYLVLEDVGVSFTVSMKHLLNIF